MSLGCTYFLALHISVCSGAARVLGDASRAAADAQRVSSQAAARLTVGGARMSRLTTPADGGAVGPPARRYTSGSTGDPKGVVHTTGGYMVQAHTSSRYVFDLQVPPHLRAAFHPSIVPERMKAGLSV